MRTPLIALARAAVFCSLLALLAPASARASIDAVDEPTANEQARPKKPPPTPVAPQRTGTVVHTRTEERSNRVEPETGASDEPAPRPAAKKVAEPPPAPVAPAPAPAAGSLQSPIVLPQGGLPDLLSHFRARQKALLEQDPHRADVEGKALRDLKVELGFPDFQTVGKALVREGQRRLDGHLGALARSAAQLAVELSPGLPAAWWLLARADLSADGFAGIMPAATACLSALRVEVENPLGRRALIGNLGVSALLAALAALALALVLLGAGVLRYALHDFHHLFPKGASPVQTGLLGLILLAVPWLFRLGPLAILGSLALMAWLYLDRQGQIVAGLALAVAVATPFVLGEIAARTAVSPLSLDLWTAETDLDADAAEARLLLLSQDPHPDVAVLAVLGRRAKRLGKLDEAEAFYRKALQLAPNRPDLENNLGNVRLLKGDYPGAKTLYESAIDHDPARAAAYFNLGQDFTRMLQLEQSQEAQRHALELDRTLIEQHMSAPPRANLFLIDSDIVFGDVAALGSSPELAARGVRSQAERRIFGSFAPLWLPTVVVLALLLAALGAMRQRLHPSEPCRKCGRAVCTRCDPGLPNDGLCGQCVNVFLRKSVADPPARIRKEAKVRDYQILRVRAFRGLAVLFGGGGHIAFGEIALGTGLLFGLAFFVVLASRALEVLRPPELGIASGVAAVVSGLFALTLYVFSVRDLFGKTR